MVLPLKRVFANVTPGGRGRQWKTPLPDGTIHLVCRGLPTSKSLFFYSPSADGLATYLFYAAPSVTLYLFNYFYGIPLWIQAEQLLEHPLLLAPIYSPNLRFVDCFLPAGYTPENLFESRDLHPQQQKTGACSNWLGSTG